MEKNHKLKNEDVINMLGEDYEYHYANEENREEELKDGQAGEDGDEEEPEEKHEEKPGTETIDRDIEPGDLRPEPEPTEGSPDPGEYKPLWKRNWFFSEKEGGEATEE